MKKIAILIAIVFVCQIGMAQTTVVVRDLESWSSLGLSVSPHKSFKINLNQQFRLDNNSSDLYQFFTNLSGEYKFTKHFSAAASFRFIRDKDGDDIAYQSKQRWGLDLKYGHKANRLSLDYRFRGTTKNDIGISKAEGDVAINYLRLRAKVGYNIKKWKFDPYFSTEIFLKNKSDMKATFNKVRLTMGTKYKIKKLGDFGLFYRIERELNAAYPLTSHIIGFKFRYNLKFKSK